MDPRNEPRPRRPLAAALAGLSMPGLGQVYNGELLAGFCYLVISVLVTAVGLRLAVHLPDRWVSSGVALSVLAALVVYLGAAIEAARAARHHGAAYLPRACNRWVFYVAAWLAGAVAVAGADQWTRVHSLETYKIASAGMAPELLRGDRVLVDKTAYRRFSPRVGDVVVHVYPDDRSRVYIRRIAALPGQVASLPDGNRVTVPHGQIYVLGDAPQSQDSRAFGPVPLADVVGKARQVWFSLGPEGVRWKRTGRVLGGGS